MPGSQRPPYASYAAIVATFAAGLGAVSRRVPHRELRALDYATLGLATFKLARTVSRERVGSFVREPFVEGEAYEGDEEPVRTGGAQQALGELVTCTRCVGAWSALGVVGLRLAYPDAGKNVANVLAVSGANDWLQAGFKALCSRAD